MAPQAETYRTIMTITQLDAYWGVVWARSAQWQAGREFSFAIGSVPHSIRHEIRPGQLLIARANLDVESAEDLGLTDFELPDAAIQRRAEELF